MNQDIIDKAMEYALSVSDKQQQQGYEFTHMHNYTSADDQPIYFKLRLKNQSTGEKYIRAISLDANGSWQMKEPDFKQAYAEGDGLKPLYNLHQLASINATEPVYIFEGEQKADLADKFGFIATTAGGANTIKTTYWQPMAGKRVVLWCDNDEAGAQWLINVYSVLSNLDCDITAIDVDKLGLPEKGDIVDWSNAQYADGEDDGSIKELIKELPTMTSEQLSDLLPSESNLSNDIIAIKPVFEHENGFYEYWQKQNGTELYFVTYKEDGEIKSKLRVCSKIEVLARSRDADGRSWGILIQWLDYDGKLHKWAMPANYLLDSSEYQRQLLSEGLRLNKAASKILDAFFINHPTKKRVRCVNKVGWYKNSYVLPELTFGSDKDSIVYQPAYYAENAYTQKGTLEQWRDKLCKPLVEQTRIAFALSVGFSGQLLELLGHNGAIFHIIGGSTMGKSIGMKVACSIWGDPEKFCDTWRSTDNGLEAKAVSRNDCIICLDEISQGNPKSVAQSTYMLINGKAKTRAKASGGNRADPEWRLMGLSNGEKTLPTYLKEAGITVNAGQLVRLIHIDADAGKGHRSFDSIVMGNSGGEQASIIAGLYQQYYGTAGIAWLEYLTQDKQSRTQQASDLVQSFINEYSGLSEQSGRVLASFAVVAAAGEMATDAGITGWQAGQATDAVKVCFQSYLDNYGSSANLEEKQVISHIAKYLQKYANSRFEDAESNVKRLSEKAGYYRQSNNTYLFATEVFTDICQPFDKRQVLKVLHKHNLIDKKSGRYDARVNLKNVDLTRAYIVSGEVINYEVA